MITPGVLSQMVEKISRALLMEGAVSGADRQALTAKVKRAIEAEFNVEDELMIEVEKILSAHMREVRSEGADVGELRKKILHQLAKEKGAVLR
jgi:hypothetical protein